MILIKLMIALGIAVAVTACQTDGYDSYKVGGELHESGAEVDPFDPAHSPG